MDALQFLVQGLSVALEPLNLFFAFFGCLIGTLVGVLPGIGPISGVALLIPVTATLTSGLPTEQAATSSIILLAGVYYGAMYGGSTTAILINTPGENSSVCTTLDGYQMAKQGRAGAALAVCAIGSFAAGLIACIGLVFMAVPLAEFALKFSPAGQFSLMILGLCALSSLAGKSQIKAFIMTTLGLILSTVGVDPISGVARLTFGYSELYSGIEFLTMAVGMFALGEVFKTILTNDYATGELIKVGKVMPTRQDLKDSAVPILRGSLLGFFQGLIPGCGATLSSFMAYTVEKKLSKNKANFGKGAIEGVAAPEAANNGAAGGAMIPLLTLGIPGTGTTAVLMGALIMFNITPGPLLFQDHPQVAWGLIASMIVGNFMLLILNLPLVKVFAKVIETPPKYLIPGIVAISVFGVYAVQVSVFNLFLMIGSGLAAYYLAKNDYPIAPLVLSLILGPMIENNLRRAMNLYNGDYSMFVRDPISLIFLMIAVLWVAIPAVMKLRGKKVIVEEGV
ncbi:transporter [Anaerosporomusa subterranea]|uniref:Transporter n=1 Tax=Anaerosporomusa subterranea TaxID=1794912 RepID=A0A154BMZ6_ANASB|nr:tripartite tricarboxylate transporter permease [Anaerosporomusa subterranea]KYZ75302.1 transporter [Anaerosporomusa subterranea]MDF2499636.1 transporter [Anaerosporomusa subterranea]